MNLVDDQGKQLGGGPKGFRLYDANGNLVQSAAGGGVGPAGADGVSIMWLGTFSSAPSSPTLNQAYRNSTDGKAYVWTGSAWSEMVQDGAPGSPGSTGPAGPGVPIGGTANQVLAKIDATDYNTHWVTPAGASTTFGPYSSLPGSGTHVGDVYKMTDNPVTAVWDGTKWNYFWHGVHPMTPPPATGWSWLNQNSSVQDSTSGPVTRLSLQNNNTGRVFYRTARAAPFTYIFGVDIHVYGNTSTNLGPLVGGPSSTFATDVLASMTGSNLGYWVNGSGPHSSQGMGMSQVRLKFKITDDGAGHWRTYVLNPNESPFSNASTWWAPMFSSPASSTSPCYVGLNSYCDTGTDNFFWPHIVLWDFQELAGVV